MIHEVDADLLSYPGLDGIVHQANCFHTMGSGIARLIREKFPEAYQADVKFMPRGDKAKLGKFSVAVLPSNFHIFNVYGQYNFGMEKRQTNYEAIYTGLDTVVCYCEDNGLKHIGLPKNMGCKLGGGHWPIVRQMIEEIFSGSGVDLTICNYG